MPWSTKFPEPIVLKDGRSIATVGQARSLMLDLPIRSQIRAYWQYAAFLPLDVAEHRGNLDEAYHQMMRALTADGLL
jgi:hypothetical protein